MSEEVANKLPEEKVKKQRGPKTVFKERPIKLTGDPFDLNKEESVQPDLDVHKKAKKRDDIVIKRYNPDIDKGLTMEEVETRIMAGAVNKTDTRSTKTIFNILVTNIFTFLNLFTIAIAVWLITVKASIREFEFLVIVIANLVIGIIQEIKAKNTIDSLSLLSAPTGLVVRDGIEVEVGINTIVIDEIYRLKAGKQISADAVIRQGTLEVDESLLTGESDIIVKKEGDPLYSGSYVVSGSAYAQVVAVGDDIYVQKLTSQAKKYKKPKSELFISLNRIIRTVSFLIIPMGIALFLLMQQNASVNGLEYKDVVLKTSGAMIGMIPTGLFLLTSSALAVGVIKLGQNNALVQELYCIEMLARVDVLCLDKTGTITDGTMNVHSVIEYKNNTGLPLKQAISAMLNAQPDHNLTSKALEERFGTAKRLRTLEDIPFSSARKFSAVTFDKLGTFVLGAPEFVIKNNTTTKTFFEEVEKQYKEGYRVLVVGHSKDDIKDSKLVGTVVPVGLIMIEDNIRPDAIETIEYFKNSGVNVRVISGDNPITVSRIAQRAGITDYHKYISLDGLSDNEVIAAATEYVIFGRVSPNQKKLLVQTLKSAGHTVGMTGDGVNDILALREADTSIALASGSEAARNVAHLVLLDSNFSSMPKVVKEGRRVINNIQKLSGLFLAKTLFTIFLAIMAITKKGIYPIEPRQLSAINMLVIGLPTFFLVMESNNTKVEGHFLVNVIKNALPGALVILINSIIIFALAGPLNMTQGVVSSLIVLSATITMFVLLMKSSMPFNVFRFIVFASMLFIYLLILFLRPDFFGIGPLSLPQVLLLLVLIQASFPLLYILNNSVRWIKSVKDKIVKIISNL